MTYFQWKPYEGGMEIWQCAEVDAAGSIPDFVKNKFAKKFSNALIILVDYLKTGKKIDSDED